MKKENDWLKGLQDKMKGYEEPAPEGLWGDVESSIFPERKRGVIAMPVFRRVAAVAAAVALGVFTGLRIFPGLRSIFISHFCRRPGIICGNRGRPSGG